MGVYAQYLVKCAGGGWLVPGRPLICHGMAIKFTSGDEAFDKARSAGWTYDPETQEHRCPQHQTGAGHVHYYNKSLATWPTGPDGETGSLRACICGEQITSEGDR